MFISARMELAERGFDGTVGKTTCGCALAVERDLAGYVDVDDIRRPIVTELGRNRCESPSRGVREGSSQVPT
jgi:hypothetical protein